MIEDEDVVEATEWSIKQEHQLSNKTMTKKKKKEWIAR